MATFMAVGIAQQPADGAAPADAETSVIGSDIDSLGGSLFPVADAVENTSTLLETGSLLGVQSPYESFQSILYIITRNDYEGSYLDFYSPPSFLDLISTDEAQDEGAEMAANTIFVSNAGELQAALSAATGGETISLAAGDYGDVSVLSHDFAETVTVVSEDPEDMAVFNTLEIQGVSNLTFDSIFVDFTPDENTTYLSHGVKVRRAENITISNSKIEGGPAVNGVLEETTTSGGLDATRNVLGLPAGKGVYAIDVANLTVENTEISQFHKGMTVAHIDGLTLSGNEIHSLRSSPVQGANVDNFLAENNYFHDFTPWQLGGDGDHGDLIHLWTDPGTQTGPSENIIIRDNLFDQGDGAALLGVYLDDNGNEIGFTNVLIENNIIRNGDSQALRLENVSNGAIRNNTLLATTDDPKEAPGIVLKDESRDLLIENNIIAGIWAETREDHRFKISAENLETIIATNNVIVQAYNELGENYYADVFVNALSEHIGVADIQALPGGVLDGVNVGALLTAFNFAPDELTALTQVRQDPLAKTDFAFDASLTADANGFVTDEHATFEWDFGDGHTGTGVAVDHVYGEPGDYSVVLTVTHADGTVDTGHATARVPDAQLLDLRFSEEGPVDASSYGSAIVFGDDIAGYDVDVEEGAYRLTDGTSFMVSKAAGQLHALNYMSVTFSLKMDSATDSAGDLMRVHGDWRMVLTDDGEISIDFENAEGDKLELTTSQAGIGDTDWHTVSFVFDGAAGQASIFVDGAKLANAAFGGMTPEQSVGGFILGNLFGEHFQGQIKGLEIRGDKPEANAAPLRHEQLLDGQSFLDEGFEHNEIKDDIEITQMFEYYNDWDSLIDTVGDAAFNIEDFEWIELDNAAAGADVGNGRANRFVANNNDNDIKTGGSNDEIYGGDGDDRLNGQADDDRIDGGDGNDLLIGHNGDDVLVGGGGIDRFYGGLGDDIYVVDHVLERVSDHGDGYDKVFASVDYTLSARIEELSQTGQADLLGRGNSADNVLTGNGGDNVLLGGSGADVIEGGDGDDVLIGHGGSDHIVGGAGADKMNGGAGADVFAFGVGHGEDTIYGFQDGFDRIDLSDYGVSAMSELASAIQDVDGSAHLALGSGDVVRLVGFDSTLLDAGDFIFAT